MPDWTTAIERRLGPLDVAPERRMEIVQELAQHLQDTFDDLRAGGATDEAARRDALAELDDADLLRELTGIEPTARDPRGELGVGARNPLADIGGDLRYACRAMRKNPGFAAVIILTLALGIGANAAMFSVVNAVVLRPLPYRDADRLVVVWDNLHRHGLKDIVVSALEFTEFRDRNRVFDRMGAYETKGFNVTGVAQPERVNGADVTAGLFPLLGKAPALGRAFRDEDEQPGRDVVMLGHESWQRLFGGDLAIVGKIIAVDGHGAEVVGVMPAGFHFPDDTVDLWRPIAFDADLLSENNRGSRGYTAIGRLKDGVTVARAQAGMNAVTSQMVREHADAYRGGYDTTVRSLQEEVVGGTGRLLFLQLAAVGSVLLIGCANVANLLLARAATRRKEVAIRTALGAKRSRIVRQLLTESVLLGVCGGAVGLLAGVWGVKLLVALAPPDIPRLAEVALDGRVVAFTAVVSVLTGVLFGTIPALQASRTDVGDTLKDGGRTSTSAARHRIAKVLIVAEVALSLVLLVAAGLLINSFARLRNVEPGFSAGHLLTMRVAPPEARYTTFEKGVAFYEELFARLRSIPGVRSTAAVNALPLSGFGGDRTFYIEGRTVTRPEDQSDEQVRFATAGYFSTMKIPLVEGREFTSRDVQNAPHVAVVNAALARRYFANGSALGRRITFSQREPLWYQVVGVAGNIKHDALDANDTPELYVPYAQPLFAGATVRPMFVVVRTEQDPAAAATSVRQIVTSIDPDLPVSNVRSMEQRLVESLSSRRFNMLLLALFAALALLLAAVGVYGLVAYAVSERTHEIGVRMALGARPRDVLAMLVGEGMVLAACGVTIGAVAALAATRVMAGLLFDVTPTDPATFAAVTTLLTFVTLCACYLPARRATRVNPVTALRAE